MLRDDRKPNLEKPEPSVDISSERRNDADSFLIKLARKPLGTLVQKTEAIKSLPKQSVAVALKILEKVQSLKNNSKGKGDE